MIFQQRKLYTQWFLFLDDLTVATGRPKSFPPGPSGAADVVESNLTFSVAASVERETKEKSPVSRFALAEFRKRLGCLAQEACQRVCE